MVGVNIDHVISPSIDAAVDFEYLASLAWAY